jgi:hypothetical protein
MNSLNVVHSACLWSDMNSLNVVHSVCLWSDMNSLNVVHSVCLWSDMNSLNVVHSDMTSLAVGVLLFSCVISTYVQPVHALGAVQHSETIFRLCCISCARCALLWGCVRENHFDFPLFLITLGTPYTCVPVYCDSDSYHSYIVICVRFITDICVWC